MRAWRGPALEGLPRDPRPLRAAAAAAAAAADKLAAFREALRTRNAAVGAGALPASDPSLMAWERRLLLAGPE